MALTFDYTENVKRLISEMYEAADVTDKEFKYTTAQVTALMQNILPENAVDDHMVYEALTGLGFKPQEEKPLLFWWYFKRKKD